MKNAHRLNVAVAAAFFLLSISVFSQSGKENDDESAAEKYFTNTVVTDQNRNDLKLYEDILKNKIVIVSSFHTTDNGISPPINANLRKIQEAFPDDLGRDLFIISITLDAERDTPERLAAYAKKFEAKPGWLFLTGEKKNVDFVLTKFGLYVDNKEDMGTTLIIGNEKTGLWKKAYGLANSTELIEIVRSVLNDGKESAMAARPTTGGAFDR